MTKQKTFITSHSSRVKRAELARKKSSEKISIFDREAIVEFYLLEDVVKLYEHRLENETNKIVETRAGEIARKRNLERFTAIINIFKSAAEIARAEIGSGNYKAVWQAIPEHALMVAASNIKYMAELREIAVQLIKDLSAEALLATEENVKFNESLDDLEDHDANVRTVKELPSEEEIEAIIKAVEVAIPSVNKSRKSNLNPNIN